MLLRALPIVLVLGCRPSATREVVVYTSVDEIYAREIFEAFTRGSGIAVRPIFDTEEAKTLGLVHRLIAERDRPVADVFWNGEAVRTALLKERGILEPFRPASARDIPAAWRDPDGAWTGFAARARVIVYNTERVKNPPKTLRELTYPTWRGRVAMANPVFGTTAAHMAALAQRQGEDETLRLLAALKANGLVVVGGNSHVRDLVAKGTYDVGLTDTDDVWIGKLRGDPIEMVYPDQDGAGTLVIPNTAALVRGAPHAAEGKEFLEFLLSRETEELLARSRSRQMPVRDGLPGLRAMEVDWSALATSESFLERARKAVE